MLEDFIQSRFVLLLAFLFALIMLVIYMFLLRYIARWMIWISLILCITVFALATTFCFTAWFRLDRSLKYENELAMDLQEMNVTLHADETDPEQIDVTTEFDSENEKSSMVENFGTAMVLLENFAPMRVVWLTFGILCCIICVALIVCVCCLCERISLAASMTLILLGLSLSERETLF